MRALPSATLGLKAAGSEAAAHAPRSVQATAARGSAVEPEERRTGSGEREQKKGGRKNGNHHATSRLLSAP